MRTWMKSLIALSILAPVNFVQAGSFYDLTPNWLDYIYHGLLVGLIFLAMIVCLLIFRNLRGGNLGRPWFILTIALLAILARSVLGILTIFDIAYFQATVFAGLDVLFFLILLIGLMTYKIGLD